MRIAKMITVSACALALAACSGSEDPVDGGPGADAGPVADSGPQADMGPGADMGPAVDMGGGGADAGMAPNPPTVGAQIDRAGRGAVSTALIAPIGDNPDKDARKDLYNASVRADWGMFTPDIVGSLAIYDSLDTVCGNQFLADDATTSSNTPARYALLGGALTDDRIFVNGASQDCSQYLAVELNFASNGMNFGDNCGGRTPNYDIIDTTYSALAAGIITGVDDTIASDNVTHDESTFPFLAAP